MTSYERDQLRAQVMRHEGYRSKPYRCSAGKLTIGYGRNLEDVGIDKDEARYLLDRDIVKALVDLATFGWFHSLDSVRQRALVNMRYQLGPTRFRGFKRMIAALSKKDYQAAAVAAADSKWAKLDTPKRAAEVIVMLKTGEMP